MDDERGLLFHNTAKEVGPLEWVEPAKTGRNIGSVNMEVLGIARDAAFVYWITGNEKYASLARNVFDVYMTGIYYRHVPIDLNENYFLESHRILSNSYLSGGKSECIN